MAMDSRDTGRAESSRGRGGACGGRAPTGPCWRCVGLGVVAGFVMTVGTQVMVAVTGTDAFCGGACHSMQWVAQEHNESVHGANRTGVRAGCHDCHIPQHYPELLWYKAKAGTKDIIGEMRGVISTEEKFKKERLRMAQHGLGGIQGQQLPQLPHLPRVHARSRWRSRRTSCRPMHQQVLEGKATCIDCHKGVGARRAGRVMLETDRKLCYS